METEKCSNNQRVLEWGKVLDPAGEAGFPEGLLVLAGFSLSPPCCSLSFPTHCLLLPSPLCSLTHSLSVGCLLPPESPPQSKGRASTFWNLLEARKVCEKAKTANKPRGRNKTELSLRFSFTPRTRCWLSAALKKRSELMLSRWTLSLVYLLGSHMCALLHTHTNTLCVCQWLHSLFKLSLCHFCDNILDIF